MRRTLLTSLVISLLSFSTLNAAAQSQIKVVTTIPDLADIAKEIGGERVDVRSICKGTENVHSVRLKPSHIVATSRADLFCQVGLSLEHAWVPGLLQTARNKKIQPGQPGHLTVSSGLTALNVPKSLSRRNGVDIHPEGNPHVNLSHDAGRHIAKRIVEALAKVSPRDRAVFEENYREYVKKCQAAEKRWAKLAKELEGRPCLQYHSEFDYLLQDLGIKCLSALEPKPGVPPTPRHIQSVVTIVRQQPNNAGTIPIFSASWTNSRAMDRIVSAAPQCEKCPLKPMTSMGGSWIEMMDLNHSLIAKAYGVAYSKEEASPSEGSSLAPIPPDTKN